MHAAAKDFGTRLLVADSFRVRGAPGAAEVRDIRLHLQRFCRAVHAVGGPSEAVLKTFMRDSLTQINDYGQGNPRLELWGNGSGQVPAELRLSLRPLPALRTSIDLRSIATPDTVTPEHKGPNIDLFTRLNHKLGAEALFTDAAGDVVEGATTAIIWWNGEAGFYSAATDRVSSVTERIVAGIAASLGTPLTPARISPETLSVHEAWAVNALHGIRPVTTINGISLHATSTKQAVARLAVYRDAYDTTWRPVQSLQL